MDIHDYQMLDGLALSNLLKIGATSAPELMQAAIALAEARNPAMNALIHADFDGALERAKSAEPKGTFSALPFLLKDSASAAVDFPATNGSGLFPATKGAADSTLVARFRKDGFIPFARTTVPEFCMAPTTEARANGEPTRNPWDLSRSTGGSSGGAAAAVAAGIVPIAHGSDGGGSIRIPAACCGVYGLKTSRGLVPHGPNRSEGWGGLAVDGVLTRSVRDTAAALDGIAGMERGQYYAAPARPESYLKELKRPFSRPLRIAKWTSAFNDIAIDPDCVAAVEHSAKLLADMGHEVIDAPLPAIKYDAFIKAIIELMAANVTVAVNGFLLKNKIQDLSTVLEPAIVDAYHRGKGLSAETYALTIQRFHGIARIMEDYIADYDFILTPTLTQLPAKLGELSMLDDFEPFRRKVGRYTAFLAIINASGQPAASLPLYQNPSGLPVGVQIIGHFGADLDVLRLSAALEEANPWHMRRPNI